MDYGPFERRVRLMVDVEPDSTSATYEAGVLEVRLTLVDRDTSARKIHIATVEDEA
jgi:HSP20 family molecular chaperone IbpA